MAASCAIASLRKGRTVQQSAAARLGPGPRARSGGVSGRRCVHGVDATETVGEEGLQPDLFLFDETRLRQMAGAEHVEHGTDTAGSRNLDRAAYPAAQWCRVDLVRV